MTNPFIEGEAIREMAGPVKPKRFIVNGSRSLITEGMRSLEKLREQFDFDAWENDLELAEFRLYENAEIEAILTDDTGAHRYLWSGEQWIEEV